MRTPQCRRTAPLYGVAVRAALISPTGWRRYAVRSATPWCAITQPTLILGLRAGCERMTSDDPPGLGPFGHAQGPKGLLRPPRIIGQPPLHLPLTEPTADGCQTRTCAFSRPLRPRVDAHPAFLVFDHGPGRQGGRSTVRLSTLLGSTRGRDEHRQWAHFPEPLGEETSTGQRSLVRLRCRARRARSCRSRPTNCSASRGYVVERGALALAVHGQRTAAPLEISSPLSPRLGSIREEWSGHQGRV